MNSDILLMVIIVGLHLLLGFGMYIMTRRSFSEVSNNKQLSDHLPWGAFVAPGVILNKNRTLMKCIGIRGPDLGSSSKEEMVAVTSKVNNALKRLGSGWSYFIEAQRFEHNNYPESSWPEPVSWIVDQERQGQFAEAGAHFESSYYLTLVWERPKPYSKKIENIFYEDPNKGDIREEFKRDLQFFGNSVAGVFNLFSTVFPEVAVLDDDQFVSYLHSTISPVRSNIKAPELPMYLDAYIPDLPFLSGDVARVGDYFMPAVTVIGFPLSMIPGVLDDLNHLNIAYRHVNRFICLDRGEADRRILRTRRYWMGKVKGIWTLMKEQFSGEPSRLVNTDAENKAADADAASQELGSDIVAYGQFTSTVSVCDKDLETAMARLHEVKKVIEAHGFVTKDEHLYAFEAWLGSVPGEIKTNVRRPLINTINLAHMMPISAIWAGDRVNAHLEEACGVGTPHVHCDTTGATPFRLNLAVGDVGHGFIGGPTGSGKSTLLGLLELQWLKYPGAQVIIFDVDRSARAQTMAVGGKYYEPGNNDAPPSYQPLAGIDDFSERVWALQFICDILRAQKVEITARITRDVEGALTSLADSPKNQRTLTGLHQLVQEDEVRDALELYTIEKPYGQLLDADSDNLSDSFWMMFEMRRVMDMGEEAVMPTLSYLFHRIEQRFNGQPTLLVLDECWLFLTHRTFEERLKDWLKTLRRKNVYVVFATQEAADATKSNILPTILNACHTRIFLPDPEALTEEVAKHYRAFGLTNAELLILATATQKQDYYYRSVRGRRLFSLDMGEVALTFAGFSSPANHRFLDSIQNSVPPERWAMAMLENRGLTWAIDLISNTWREAA